ncbi:MAG: hypothetical protein LH606_21470 [Cytophagaceae bacterium]|nr:hypothetical protein [Cytophagaceae bacterium]
MANTKITSYVIFYSANTFSPRIWLKSEDKFVGQLTFMRHDDALPEDKLVNGQINLFYRLADFQNVMDMLRNEQPIYLSFNGSGGGNENAILTGSEMVGEGE